MSYLLDTCVLSKLRKLRRYPDDKLENWIKKHPESSYFVSVLTIGEIQVGISKLNVKKPDERQKKIILEDWFFEELIPRFQQRTLMISSEVALAWGKLAGESQQKGIVIPIIDGLIAATALVHDLTVVTENLDDFMATGTRVFNPWQV